MRHILLFLVLAAMFLSACSKPPEATSEAAPPTEEPATPNVVPTEPTNTEGVVEAATEEIAPTEVLATATIPPLPTAVSANEPTATPIPPIATTVPQALVQSITLNPIANGFISPVFLTHAFDERLFVVEQAGTIRIIDADGSTLAKPFLNITDRVGSASNEQGLLSMAFHPDHAQNGRFFVNYTNKNGNTTISRFTVSDDPNVADPASEEILLTIDQPFPNHNGGQIAFGPDGYLYIGMGDGGSQFDPQNNAQNPNTLLGSILRIDINEDPYGIPADNPFVNSGNGRSEIWAIGLRNPWRFSFDRQTDDLFIADVGQNTWEEANFQPANSGGGENYGWSIIEGNHCIANNCTPAQFTPPILEYSHEEGGCSITGGYIYRGEQFPELTGNYFYSDFCSGKIWAAFLQDDGVWETAVIADTDLNPTSFGQDLHGEIYILSRTGTIYQLTP